MRIDHRTSDIEVNNACPPLSSLIVSGKLPPFSEHLPALIWNSQQGLLYHRDLSTPWPTLLAVVMFDECMDTAHPPRLIGAVRRIRTLQASVLEDSAAYIAADNIDIVQQEAAPPKLCSLAL